MSKRRIVVAIDAIWRWCVTWFIDATLTEATGVYHNIAKRAYKEATHYSYHTLSMDISTGRRRGSEDVYRSMVSQASPPRTMELGVLAGNDRNVAVRHSAAVHEEGRQAMTPAIEELERLASDMERRSPELAEHLRSIATRHARAIEALRGCLVAMGFEMEEWDRGIVTEEIKVADEWRWENKDIWDASLAAARAVLEEEKE